MSIQSWPPIADVVVKVTARCNLDCTYCYVFNLGDESWRGRPPIMTDEVFEATVRRMREYVARSGQRDISLVLHGGEPCLAGRRRMERWLIRAREIFSDGPVLSIGVQTNATLLDERWVELFRRHQVAVSVSLDGPPEVNDSVRIDHRGRGTYGRVTRGIELLRAAGTLEGVIAVLQLGADGGAVHRRLVELGFKRLSYLPPDTTWDLVDAVREGFGPTPVADYLIAAFDEWWPRQAINIRVRQFDEAIRGLRSGTGSRPQHFAYVVVQTDGSIHGDDVLGITDSTDNVTGLHVLSHGLSALRSVSPTLRDAVFDGTPLPQACEGCDVADGCGGGQLAHRWSTARGLDNPTAWCADQLRFLNHIRSRLGPLSVSGSRRRLITTGVT